MGRAAGWGRPKRGLFSWWSRFLGTKLLEPQNATRPDAQKSRPRRFPSAGRERLSPTSRHPSAFHRRPRRGRSPRVAPAASSPASGLRPPPPRAPAARRCQAVQSPGAASSPPTVAQVFRSGPRSTCTCPALPGTARPPPLSSVLGPAKLAGASEPLLGCAGVTPTPRPPLLAGPCSLQPPQTCPLQTAQLLGGAVLRSPLRCWPRGRGQGPRWVRGLCGGSGQGGRSC